MLSLFYRQGNNASTSQIYEADHTQSVLGLKCTDVYLHWECLRAPCGRDFDGCRLCRWRCGRSHSRWGRHPGHTNGIAHHSHRCPARCLYCCTACSISTKTNASMPSPPSSSHLTTTTTLSQKDVPPLTCYNLDVHDPIAIIFGRRVTDEVRNQMMLVFPPHLSGASALACERGNPEDSELVLCGCNTVQLLQHSRLHFLSWAMPPKAPSWMHLLWDLGNHTAVWVWVVSQKDWRNQAATGWILAMH